MKEAYLYKSLKDKKVRCDLCNHRCVIDVFQKGKCGVRQNIDGKLFSMVYDKVISENVDPIEKKPLFHFLPGTLSLSIATPGCNFKCFFCQNWQISQMPSDYNLIEGKLIPPEKIVNDAIKYNCPSISYTYTEPTIYFELAYDTAKLAAQQNIKNIFVTNGFMSLEALEMIRPYLNAANIDLKSFSEKFYKEKIGGRLKPVLKNIKTMFDYGIWIEITTLLIPGLNDSSQELKEIASFISSISISIPWHISAYFPQYKSDIPPTSKNKIMEAVQIGKDSGLKYVYGGNVFDLELENTYCFNCKNLLIKRRGFSVLENNVVNKKCKFCNTIVEGVFND